MTTINAVNTNLSGQTGTGNFVGSTSPTALSGYLQAPSGFKDSNGNIVLNNTAAASAVNYVQIGNAATGNHPAISGVGSDTNVILNVLGQGTGGVAIHGTGTNDNAAAGYVGEFISSVVAAGSAISLTTATPANVTSISLTAGNWITWGNVFFVYNVGGTISSAWISSTSASVPDFSLINQITAATAYPQAGISAPMFRFSLASTTTIYLSCAGNFASGTGTAAGGIYAIRIR